VGRVPVATDLGLMGVTGCAAVVTRGAAPSSGHAAVVLWSSDLEESWCRAVEVPHIGGAALEDVDILARAARRSLRQQ
jgi:hypothetical protein